MAINRNFSCLVDADLFRKMKRAEVYCKIIERQIDVFINFFAMRYRSYVSFYILFVYFTEEL